jgi:putative ABC transport system permease protein
MHFLPIISTLRRHRTAVTLIVLEIALTCAIVCNAVFLIGDRLAKMDKPSGIVEDEIVRVQLTGIGKASDVNAVTRMDLAALRAIPGVKFATTTNMVPFGQSSWNTDISTILDDPNGLNAGMYMGSPDLLETLGAKLVEGRDFNPDEYVQFDDVRTEKANPSSIILTRALAARLFPGKTAIGQKVYANGKEPQVVVGILDYVARPNEFSGARDPGFAMFFPVEMPYSQGGNYLIRTEASRKGEVLGAIAAAFDRVDKSRILLKKQTFAEIRRDYFRQDRAMAYLLVGVSIALLIITALGVVGLASFWVQQRTRQIGVRRALGATRGDILRYFQTENFILATAGIVIGMGLAYALNLELMHKYQVARLPAMVLPIGAIVLWTLGQIAVLGPALRATQIPPAIATRSV